MPIVIKKCLLLFSASVFIFLCLGMAPAKKNNESNLTKENVVPKKQVDENVLKIKIQNFKDKITGQGDRIGYVMDDRIATVKEKGDGIEDRIYFFNESGDEIKSIKIFPESAKNKLGVIPGRSDKYVGLSINYIENGKNINRLAVYANDGRTLGNIDINNIYTKKIIFNDEKNQVVIVDPFLGKAEIRDIHGFPLKSIVYSKWVETFDDEDELRVDCSLVYDENSKKIILCRTGHLPLRYEVTIFDYKLNILYSNTINDFAGSVQYISSKNNSFIVFETNNEDTVRKYIAYDFEGRKKWELDRDKDKIRSKGKFVKNYKIVNDKDEEIDLLNGKIKK